MMQLRKRRLEKTRMMMKQEVISKKRVEGGCRAPRVLFVLHSSFHPCQRRSSIHHRYWQQMKSQQKLSLLKLESHKKGLAMRSKMDQGRNRG